MTGLHPQAQRVHRAGADHGLDLVMQEYPEGTRTADDAAAAVGCKVDQIVKSMIFAATGRADDATGLVLALTSGAHQVDPDRLAALTGAERCGRADPDDVRAATGYAIGGVPPFGHTTALATWIDPHLLTFDRVWAAGGTPRHVFGIAPGDLVAATGAEVGDFTADRS